MGAAALRFFVTAARGTERALADELRELGMVGAKQRTGGVALEGTLELGYRATIESRIASRVLLNLAEGVVKGADSLYALVASIPWADHWKKDATLAVHCPGPGCGIGDGRFAALKTKDAIVDALREKQGRRPDVDREDPSISVHVHLGDSKAVVSIDLAGDSLHRRAVGRRTLDAPLKENLAAAMLAIAGWPDRGKSGQPLVDPMCGSGTLLLEAAWIARDVAPGLGRSAPGSPAWAGHDRSLWRACKDEAQARVDGARDRPVRVVGYDASAKAVEIARANIASAGLGDAVTVEVRPLADAAPPDAAPGPGLVVTNPPYGERLGEESALGFLYAELGDVLRRRFLGWDGWVLTGSPALAKRIGLAPRARHVLMNGPIECRFLEFPISSDAPRTEKTGPAWRKRLPESEMFLNRLKKNLRKLRRAAARDGTTCYRIYDADIPEFNLRVDWYDGKALLQEYARPRGIDAGRAADRLRDARAIAAEVLELPVQAVIVRGRSRRSADEQYERLSDAGQTHVVTEGGLRFCVNLSDYLDTGIFLDQRSLRARLAERARGKSFLNLFAYTCTASVYAAHAGAQTTSVDLSNTYLAWGKHNFELNQLGLAGHHFARADALRWIAQARGRYDVVLLAPPTYSRSKGMDHELDLQRDHGELVRATARLLAPGGELYFVAPSERFVPEPDLLKRVRLPDSCPAWVLG